MANILLVSHDLPTAATLVVATHPYATTRPVASVAEAVRHLDRWPTDLVVFDHAAATDESRAFLRLTRDRRCPVLLVAAGPALRRFAGGRIRSLPEPLTIAALVTEIGRALPRRFPACSRYVSDTMEYVRANYRSRLTVGRIAAAIAVSPSHLAHRFRLETGMTPMAYVANVRVELVKLMLLGTDRTIDGIAELVGFCDAPHLSRTFLRYTRRRPGAYRRRPPAQSAAPRDGAAARRTHRSPGRGR